MIQFFFSFLCVVLQDTTAKIYYNGTLKHNGTSYIPKNITQKTNYVGKTIYYNSSPEISAIIDGLKIFNIFFIMKRLFLEYILFYFYYLIIIIFFNIPVYFE